MKQFTGYEYILIDVANNHYSDLDKKTFEERIQWANDNLATLENEYGYEGKWKNRPMYVKAVMALRKAQQGIPTGHLVGFDAVCSGMQIMSAATGCIDGARATGLVDPNRRADAYTDCTNIMAADLGLNIPVQRKDVKTALMTALYGSKAEPKKVFGEGSDELNAFYRAMYKLAPGACELLDDLLNSWRPYALLHEWIMPDGYHARVKVMQKVEHRIEVDELGHHEFHYEYYVNQGEKKGVKNAANVVHSIDAYVLRSLVRRCNYDHQQAWYARHCIEACLLERATMSQQDIDEVMAIIGKPEPKLDYYMAQYERSSMADIVILPHLDQGSVWHLSDKHLRGLNVILNSMLEHKPFEIITVHDDFKCHPNNMNWLRKHYTDILADIADSEILSDIFSQLHGQPVVYNKLSNNLGPIIRQANYALC